jgi:DNA polymerase I-like protein with 3'-5' exonuclease and polymerase domains
MVQTPLFSPETGWKPRPVSRLPSWKNAKRVAIDIETCDPDLRKIGPGVRRDGFMVGVSFAIEDGDSFYLPFAHEGGDNLDKEKVLQYLRDQAKVFTGDLVTANGQYDLDYLAHSNVIFSPRFFRDVQVAEPILDENQFQYNLDAIAVRYGLPGKHEDELKAACKAFGFKIKKEYDIKKHLWKLPARYIGTYAEQDAALPLKLLRRQERIIDDQDLWQIYDLESRLLPVLLKMRRRGVLIDQDQLDKVEAWSIREEAKALRKLKSETGMELSPKDTNRPVVVAKLFELIGITLPETPTGQPSIKQSVLDNLPENPITELFLRARKFNKIRNTFVESIRTHMCNGRIHCTFNQLKREKDAGGDTSGTITGRLSSCDPNLQQQPKRDDELGAVWRTIYIPDEGGRWACLDFSQQEPRWIVHYASIVNKGVGLIGSKEAVEQYIKNPDTDFHQMMSDITGIKRKIAKNILLGLIYGMGGAKLCKMYLHLPTKWKELDNGNLREDAGDEGQKILDQFNSRLPFVKGLAKKVKKVAGERGWIKTVYGRKCRFTKHKSGKSYEFTYKALNKLIQGSSADQIKLAMVQADAEGIRLQLQVHDELDLTFWKMKEIKRLKDIMETVITAKVPHRVDMEVGPSWGKIKKVT